MILRYTLVRRYFRANPTTIEWNQTLRTHHDHGKYQQALKLFQLGIEKKSFVPNVVTYLTMIDVCKRLKSSGTLREIHRLIDASTVEHRHDDDVRLRSSIMDAYMKCDDLSGACDIFRSMKQPNLIDYCSLMTSCNQHAQYETTLDIARDMSTSLIVSSPIVCTLLLQACSALNRYDDGHRIQQLARHWLDKDKIFMNESMNFHLKFDNEQQALDIFERHRNQLTIIDYSSWMKYYNRQCRPDKTIEFYRRLTADTRMSVDHIVYVLVLQAIANGCCSQMSASIIERVNKHGINIDMSNALINMYGN
jgi:pentatricopeptide repeat protein